MSWWSRLLNIRRAAEPRYVETARIPYEKIAAGVRVDADTALTVSAVWACLRYLSQTVAVLPWHVMKDQDGGGTVAGSHPVNWLVWKRPNPEWSSLQFRETLTHWALRHGNGHAEIERDSIGRPLALWPIHPDRVQHMRPEGGGPLFYRIDGKTDLAASDVFHIRGFGEGPVGVNVMEYAAQSIGWARAAQIFGAAFFGNGMNVGGYVKLAAGLTPDGKAELEKELRRKVGGPKKAGAFPILDAGMEIVPLGIDPDKGQFIATNQHLVEETCRWFGVPPHKIAHLLRATFSNIEHQGIEVVQDSIMPWAKRFEDEADYKLFGQNRQGYYTKINLTALLRGDSAARAAYYKAMREIGVYSTDDIRRLEDMRPVGKAEGGQKLIVQINQTTLEKIGQDAPAPADSSPPDPPAPPPDPSPAEAAAMAGIVAMAEELDPLHAF